MRNLSVHSLLLAALLLSTPALAQPLGVDVVKKGPKKQKGPTKSEWVAAGLDPAEYALAINYDVGIDEWKQLERSRKNHSTAGWACMGVSALAGGIVATLWIANGWNLSDHPQMEVFALSMVAAGATLLTGVVLAATSPEPEDFVQKWRHDRGLSFNIGETTLTPGLNGMVLTF
jgi:hypothetical protein